MRERRWGPITRARQARTLALYGCMVLLAIGLILVSAQAYVEAFALGLIVPGGGFLAWAVAGGSLEILAICLFALSILLFLAALVIWFATGNVLLPIAVWTITALVGATWGQTDDSLWRPALQIVPLGTGLALAGATGAAFLAGRLGLRRRARLNQYLRSLETKVVTACDAVDQGRDELSLENLQLLRLLLDRALQPVEAFEGFEWVDQFQTSAVRYQLNFMSYALSIAQREQLPAFQGYLETAQVNLIAKQQNHRIWRYWQLENMWGNLRRGADPIARDNIMLSGFLAAQIAYHQSATGQRTLRSPDDLTFEHPSGERFTYSFPALIDVLVRQYRQSDYGLVACEPNWIYPLCNAITASAIRAYDAMNGTSHWRGIEGTFRQRLESEFIAADGRFIPCRSSYSGFAMPMIGGAVIQAFPCFFLSALLPDIAQRQWQVLRHDLDGMDMRRALWPVDVGNYRLSRASSYAATAAAAVEMGDSDMAMRLLRYLEEDCPLTVSGTIAYRPNASLWAHAVELIARCGRAGSLRSLVTTPRVSPPLTPFIKHANYPDVLVAKAVNTKGPLFAVLYPGEESGSKALTIGGLVPDRSYVGTVRGTEIPVRANPVGEACLTIPLEGRTELLLKPTA